MLLIYSVFPFTSFNSRQITTIDNIDTFNVAALFQVGKRRTHVARLCLLDVLSSNSVLITLLDGRKAKTKLTLYVENGHLKETSPLSNFKLIFIAGIFLSAQVPPNISVIFFPYSMASAVFTNDGLASAKCFFVRDHPYAKMGLSARKNQRTLLRRF